MIDIHTHIMPYVDDGADSMEEALGMLRLAAASKTDKIVITPHYLNPNQCRYPLSKRQLTLLFEKLRQECSRQIDGLELYLGAEHFGVSDIARAAQKGQLIPINGSKYVLIEFDFDDDYQRISYVLSQIEKQGFIPVIAHPERYDFIAGNSAAVYSLLERGCILQINSGSPLGHYGYTPQRVSKWLLDNHLAHVVASDCHGPYQRTPQMSEAHETLTYRLGSDYVRRLFEENPLRIINNEAVTL